jgi:glycogen operon protein
MSLTELIRQANKGWHGVKLGQPDWGPSSHAIALTMELSKDGLLAHAIVNAYWEPLEFELPATSGGEASPWRRWIDTSLDSPDDITPWEVAPPVPGRVYQAEARSVVVLFSASSEGGPAPGGR